MFMQLKNTSSGMTFSAGLVKLVITVFIVPVPILALALVGFWLDYYRFETLPILTIIGALLGTLLSFIAVYRIIMSAQR
ncbi:MAG: hypothetical protein A2144_09205 [Chloroflexi bacterium RBG_16_50_9]|nr:MAG: hypothetical protein A2144_09205 [Chloroflexi bacterium RBG_16_50_9]